jgi:hypothetical protein
MNAFHLARNGSFTSWVMIAVLVSSALNFSCGQEYTISVEDTTEHLRFLSSDELKGRHALSPEITLAEDYIATEFKKAGLKPLNGLNDYRQSFAISEYSISSVNATLNGKPLAENSIFGRVFTDSLVWTSMDPNAYEVTTISKDDSFRARLGELNRSASSTLVFVDSEHADTFNRYQQFYSRPSRTMSDQNPSVVYILAPNNFNSNSSFTIIITTEKTEFSLANVAGYIPGERTDEIVLFSAHHDHIGIRSVVEGDSIANGANDNASGVSSVIQLAHYYSSLAKPERSIYFVTFTAEEMGGYGSRYFSQQLNPDEIVAMFNMEMIGKPAVSGPNSAWITGYDRSSFGQILSDSAPDSVYEFYPDPYPSQNLFYRSDNATLARLGVPAHSISTTPIDVDPDYHQVSDELETIDLEHLNNTIKAIARAATGIISGVETPTRIDPETVNR